MAENKRFESSELDCSDCVNHGGDWECDYVHCRKGGTDTISRVSAIDTVRKAKSIGQAHRMLMQLPSTQPNLSEAYSKAVFTWLMDYQIRVAELKGRYTPYEVLSWVINDWRKENG